MLIFIPVPLITAFQFIRPFINKKTIIIGLIIIHVIMGFFYWKHRTNKIVSLTEQNIQLGREIKQVSVLHNSEVLSLRRVIKDQNDVVQELSERSIVLKKRLILAENNSMIIKEEYRKSVQDILNEPTPKTCEETMDYLKNVEDLVWEK